MLKKNKTHTRVHHVTSYLYFYMYMEYMYGSMNILIHILEIMLITYVDMLKFEKH